MMMMMMMMMRVELNIKLHKQIIQIEHNVIEIPDRGAHQVAGYLQELNSRLLR